MTAAFFFFRTERGGALLVPVRAVVHECGVVRQLAVFPMIAKGLTPFSGAKVFAIMKSGGFRVVGFEVSSYIVS